jgi:AraC family transcriptional regulator
MDRVTESGAVFETHHAGGSTLHYHRHGISFITIVLDGSYTEVRDREPRPCGRGSLVIHPGDEEHADHFLKDARCVNLELPNPIAVSGVVKADWAIRSVVESVVRAFYGNPDSLQAAVEQLQTALRSRLQVATPAHPDWLQPVLDEFAWCEPVPQREAARMAGVHPVQFSRAFHRHVGMTANQYRRQSRLRRASELLLSSTAPLARIAQHCGFADQSHLTRAFSQTLGLSPARYRHVFAR